MTDDRPFTARPVALDGRRCCCVEVEGDLDLASAPRLKAQLVGLLGEGVSHLLVDMSATTSVDSSGLATLVAVQRRVREQRGAMAVVMADDHITDRFERAGVDRLLDIAPSQAAAVARLAQDDGAADPA